MNTLLIERLHSQAQHEFDQHYDFCRRNERPLEWSQRERFVELIVEQCALCSGEPKDVRRMYEVWEIERG